MLADVRGAGQTTRAAGREPMEWRRARGAKNWDQHVEHMEQLAATRAFREIRDLIIELAELQASDRLLDIGAGTGLLALAAAPRVARVSAVDVSPAMCRRLRERRELLGVANIEVLTESATNLPLADGTTDVVVSNYCFHHLGDREKVRALAEIARVLRPGGRLVFADMMFGVSLIHRRDRAVIARLVRRMLRHGPSGAVRVARNVARVASGRGEHPARVEWWRDALVCAGFVGVSVQALDHEGGIACARRPSRARARSRRSEDPDGQRFPAPAHETEGAHDVAAPGDRDLPGARQVDVRRRAERRAHLAGAAANYRVSAGEDVDELHVTHDVLNRDEQRAEAPRTDIQRAAERGDDE